MKLVECIPNFSEGKDPVVLEKIAKSIESIKGVKLLHQDAGFSANRTVYTFAGECSAVFEAAFEAIKVAAKNIDMRKHHGTHPRIGACDVCPFVPISGISMEELVEETKKFAERVNRELSIPIYLYENSASSTLRKNLTLHREGNYEHLKQRIEKGIHLPDYGNQFNAKSGATVIGARNFLLAYNINLNTQDVGIAKKIAEKIRASGKTTVDKNGEKITTPGLLKEVKAIGWFIPEFKSAQVSINLINFKVSGLHTVYETCKKLAEELGIKLNGSELIGLAPKEAILDAGKFYIQEQNNPSETELIQAAIKGLGLDAIEEFEPRNRILEFLL